MLLGLVACDDPSPTPVDATVIATPRDAGHVDATSHDASIPDVPAVHDAGMRDADAPDVGIADATPPDAGADVVEVIVTLDGVPTAGIRVLQGGTEDFVLSDADGRAFVTVDRSVPGENWILASHPQARIWGDQLLDDHVGPFEIALDMFSLADNPPYVFQDPGEPTRRPNTSQCSHCHQTIGDSWFESPHRTSASNPRLHDLYEGAAAALDETQCTERGGTWSRFNSRCELGDGVVDRLGGGFGACADCHAPGIDGALGGRDLRDATGVAKDYGVHCEVCHHVESIDLAQPAGVAGRLKIVRPLEDGPLSLGGGGFLPLTFGPDHDVPNPKMGTAQRDHFRDSTICAGCHQLDQAALVPGETLDPVRWPDGALPIHSTFEEWRTGPFGDAAPCQSCHMPPDPLVSNTADFQRFPFAQLGIQGGFIRPPGAVREHSWLGPRTPDSRILEHAAAIFINKSMQGGSLTAQVTVRNVGCGHALPTGEPMRSVILEVDARCGSTDQPATGGDVVPDFGGYVATQTGGDFSVWPDAQIGDVVRVVRRLRGYYDYQGFGPFGDGRFDIAGKGMPLEAYAGSATITAIAPTGELTFSAPLPSGERAYLIRGDASAGRPGFAFARVLVDAAGNRMVPHYLAVDVASDNRLLPQQSWTSRHTFDVSCNDPTVHARLVHRDVPREQTVLRGWTAHDTTMIEVSR